MYFVNLGNLVQINLNMWKYYFSFLVMSQNLRIIFILHFKPTLIPKIIVNLIFPSERGLM